MNALFQDRGGWYAAACALWVAVQIPAGAQTVPPAEPPPAVVAPRAIPVQSPEPAAPPETIVFQVPSSQEAAPAPAVAEVPAVVAEAVPEIPQPAPPPPGTTGMDGMPKDPMRPIVVEILSPQPREIVAEQTVDIFFQLQNYLLGTAEAGGNRLHVILDNQPPRPVFETARPLTLKNLSQGGHAVRVLVVRPDGTWIEGEKTFAMRHFYVGRKDFQNQADEGSPFLTVNLPGDGMVDSDEGDRMAFDYIMHNARPEDGYQVRYAISGYEGFLQERGPVYWRNILPGKHRLVVEFFDGKGQPVFGPFNRVERVFELRKILKAIPMEPEPSAGQEMPTE